MLEIGGLKIHYEITVDDVIAFHRYHIAHTPYLKQPHVVMTVVVMLLVLAGLGLAAWYYETWFWLLVGLLFCVFYPFQAARDFDGRIDKTIRKLYAEGKNQDFLGPRDLELSGSTITETTALGSSTIKLEAIEKIVSTEEHTFFYLGTLSAHILPRAAVSEMDYQTFVQAVERAWEQRPA